MERASDTRNHEIEEQSESSQDNAWNVLDSNNSERELTESASPRGNVSAEEDVFCLDDSNCADESSVLLSQSQTIQEHDYNAINPVSMTVSVIVHSPSNNIT